MVGMWLGYDICGINEWITKILMTMIVLVYNYVTRKLFIFKSEAKTTATENPASTSSEPLNAESKIEEDVKENKEVFNDK